MSAPATLRVAAASDPSVAQAARNALATGNAVDAVVAGVLMACAGSPGVLLGSMQALVGGAGAGRMAIDGRARQPGLGLPRPRGLVEGTAGPAAGAAAVPGLPAGLAALLAFAGTSSWRKLGAAAVKAARLLSPERAGALAALGKLGVPALGSDAIFTELAAAAGRSVGGFATRDDLAAVQPTLAAVEPGEGGWLALALGAAGADASNVEVVAAADGKGLVCIACYATSEHGVAIPALGLLAPAVAAPVVRGEVRVRPGDPRPAPAPIALRLSDGIVDHAVGLARDGSAADGLEALLKRLEAATLASEALASAPGRPVA